MFWQASIIDKLGLGWKGVYGSEKEIDGPGLGWMFPARRRRKKVKNAFREYNGRK
jgi:hypothetical protein